MNPERQRSGSGARQGAPRTGICSQQRSGPSWPRRPLPRRFPVPRTHLDEHDERPLLRLLRNHVKQRLQGADQRVLLVLNHLRRDDAQAAAFLRNAELSSKQQRRWQAPAAAAGTAGQGVCVGGCLLQPKQAGQQAWRAGVAGAPAGRLRRTGSRTCPSGLAGWRLQQRAHPTRRAPAATGQHTWQPVGEPDAAAVQRRRQASALRAMHPRVALLPSQLPASPPQRTLSPATLTTRPLDPMGGAARPCMRGTRWLCAATSVRRTSSCGR